MGVRRLPFIWNVTGILRTGNQNPRRPLNLMSSPAYTVGFVYVLTNESMPGTVKIGLTSGLPEDRAKKLYTTGVPQPFEVAYRTATSRPEAVERRAHELLHKYRTNAGREFFRVTVAEAVDAVRRAAVEAAGIGSWESPTQHLLKLGDRLALTLESGQVFALIGYHSFDDILAGKANIIDLWQAHSDGDLLEIFGTGSAGHVAGFSDGDPGGTDDPVPYLDRGKTVANGLINGRERLMPGERLVWLPAPEDSETETSVVFEARDYCQVVSRTWSPALGPNGLPLLLNDFMHTDVWPAADRAIREALALSAPRTWAPRQDRGLQWETIGSQPPNPEHWLPQLKRRHRKR